MKTVWLIHSAKGSEWENHKYLKRIDGTYYYPDDYEGGRHLSDLDVENLATETIRGNFGNGQVRKDLLGEDYDQIQDRVNQILLGPSYTSRYVPGGTSAEEKAQNVVENIVKKTTGVDLASVYSVYRKDRKKKYDNR